MSYCTGPSRYVPKHLHELQLLCYYDCTFTRTRTLFTHSWFMLGVNVTGRKWLYSVHIYIYKKKSFKTKVFKTEWLLCVVSITFHPLPIKKTQQPLISLTFHNHTDWLWLQLIKSLIMIMMTDSSSCVLDWE